MAFFFILCRAYSYGQNKNTPRNLKAAVKILNNDCPDSLKLLIKNTDNKDLKKLSYPWGGDYKTIFEWTSYDNTHSKIKKYLTKNGISAHQETVILIAFKQFLLEQKFDENLIFEPFLEIENKWAQENKARFTTDTLRGVYIPKDIEDCFIQINGFWNDSVKTKVKQWTEDEFSGRVHLGFGMWLRNNWQLWAGSRLSKYFNEKDIHHPDNMSGIILTSYHRHLNATDIILEEQIKFDIDNREEFKRKEIERKKEEFEKYKKGDTVLFIYNLGFTSDKQEEDYDNDVCIAKGKIIEKDGENFFIKIRLLVSCDKNGIIYYDNENSMIFNEKTKKWEKPKKRKIKYMKKGKENWFAYEDWETDE